MAITVGELVHLPQLGLRLRAGTRAELDRVVDWAAVSEFADPTPSLTGGEVVLTTGMRLVTPDDCRHFVAALVRAGSRGIGFGSGTGLGFAHDRTPEAMLAACRDAGVPLFDVPPQTTFAMVSRTIANAQAAEQFARIETQHRMHQQLVELLLGDHGLEAMLDRLASYTHAQVAVSRNGELLHSAGDEPGITGWDALPIAVGANTQATLHISRPRREEALVASARSLIGLFLAQSSRRMADERERAGQVLADLIGGRLTGDLAKARLASIGVDTRRRQRCIVVTTAPTQASRRRELARMPLPASFDQRIAALIDGDLVVVVDAAEDAREAGEALVAATHSASIPARVGIGGGYPPTTALRWSFFEAQDALARLGGDEALGEASKLSVSALILGAESAPIADLAAQVLGPLELNDRDQGTALVATLDAFLAHSGSTHDVAAALGTHRNTVRYRIDQITRLSGLDPRVTSDAVQLSLARTARRILSP